MLIDTFLYYNEEELVELRLKYLNNIVDYFVVIEADVTHQGNKKGWNFPKILNNQLKSYSNKIQYHQVNIDLEESKKSFGWIDENTKGGQSWKIENMQRDFIKDACQKFSPTDIIIISDSDEIASLLPSKSHRSSYDPNRDSDSEPRRLERSEDPRGGSARLPHRAGRYTGLHAGATGVDSANPG